MTKPITVHTSFLAFRRQNRGILLQMDCCQSSAALSTKKSQHYFSNELNSSDFNKYKRNIQHTNKYNCDIFVSSNMHC